jgi:hypothetical protein
MQIELRDGNSDFGKLQAITSAVVANAQTQSALQRVSSPSARWCHRARIKQFGIESYPAMLASQSAAKCHRTRRIRARARSGELPRRSTEYWSIMQASLWPHRWTDSGPSERS